MRTRTSFAEAADRKDNKADERREYYGYLVAPPGGFLVRSRQGWLHHRARWGTRFPYAGERRFTFSDGPYTVWETECGQNLSSGKVGVVWVPLDQIDFVCGRCEMVAVEAGLLPPTNLLSEGVCEARQNLDALLSRVPS